MEFMNSKEALKTLVMNRNPKDTDFVLSIDWIDSRPSFNLDFSRTGGATAESAINFLSGDLRDINNYIDFFGCNSCCHLYDLNNSRLICVPRAIYNLDSYDWFGSYERCNQLEVDLSCFIENPDFIRNHRYK